MADLTPMMQQYRAVKQMNPDCLLFFRLGDFYEMFEEDARIASRELDLTLTTRDRSKDKPDEEKIPMCGVPFHSSEAYIARLVSRGYKVAICEQMEDPALAKGLVKRDIIRIVSPGSVTESSMLDESRNNYYVCVFSQQEQFGLAFCDVSTGSFCATGFSGEGAIREVINELGAYVPSEALLGGGAAQDEALLSLLNERMHCCVNIGPDEQFQYDLCSQRLSEQFGRSVQEPQLSSSPAVVCAIGALLGALRDAQKNDLPHIHELELYKAGKFMGLDLNARRNLELVETMRSKEKRGTLLWVMDKTRTAMGGRLLRSWMERPLLSPAQITRRLNATEELVKKTIDREELITALDSVTDLERAMTRIATATANARDLRMLAQGAENLPAIRERLSGMRSPMLRAIYDEMDTLEDLSSRILSTIADNPPFVLHEGGLIRKGAVEEVDRLRSIQENGAALTSQMEAKEKEATGIRNLRIGYNRVFGYYIEVSKTQTGMVPEHYVRKQTITTGERYITQELKELENTILTAKERVVALEYELFCELRGFASEQAERVQKTAQLIAQLDVLCSYASVAVHNHYCKPEIDLSGAISITAGRHPVVEQVLKDSLFVPNDTRLGAEGCQIAIITGPNMAGKSTYMRQVALIVLMAQMGSFVPASSARIGIVDRLFTRIGASDDLASGQSTFMVEMNEVADILKNATADSLLILDEIGRGTSTFDGMAIARAVLEHAADRRRLGAKTLFATHYHELTAIEQELPGVRNFNIAVKKRADDMIFLRKIVPGAADDSYGVEVAKLAGLPDRLIHRARQILRELEDGSVCPAAPAGVQGSDQISILDLHDDALRRELEALNPETMTPIEAMNELFRLKKLL